MMLCPDWDCSPILFDVLYESAILLGLDPQQAAESGKLMWHTTLITDIKEDLEARKVHELTQVLT